MSYLLKRGRGVCACACVCVAEHLFHLLKTSVAESFFALNDLLKQSKTLVQFLIHFLEYGTELCGIGHTILITKPG